MFCYDCLNIFFFKGHKPGSVKLRNKSNKISVTMYNKNFKMQKTQQNKNKVFSYKRLVKLFVTSLKKNTLALKDLKISFDSKTNKKESIDKIFEVTNSINEKLETVNKLRNDIKIYKTINTILTNHYIKETKNHENSIDEKIIKLERQILQSYDSLKSDISKMADACVVSEKKSNISSPIQNSSVIMVGNDLNVNQINELYIRNEIYNTIIKKIDKLFCNLVSLCYLEYVYLFFFSKIHYNYIVLYRCTC